QFIFSYYVSPFIVDVAAGGISLACMVMFLRVWKPAEIMTDPTMRFPDDSHSEVKIPAPLQALPTAQQVIRAWTPWVILCVVLAFAATGVLFPFFSAVLGWLGVAATGSDTSANVLFGGLQVVAANTAHFNPVLMAAANSTGGCMGKIIAISSIVIASAATGW